MNDATHDLPPLIGQLTTVLRIQAETDQELLRPFTARRDEDAFAELVRRHGALVYGTAF